MSFGLVRLRKVLEARGSYEQCGDGVDVFPAPDGSRAIAFSHGWEVTMMNWSYCFTLLDRGGRIEDLYEPLRAVHPICEWSPDSRLAAVPVAPGEEALFIADVKARRFAFVRLPNRQCRHRFDGPRRLRLEFDPDQLAAMNAQAVFGGGKAQFPVERFRAPAPQVVDVKQLDWQPAGAMKALKKALAAAPLVELAAVRDGFHPFTGPYPASTTASINGRKLEVWHLLAFARHGDRQAQAWLDELEKRAKQKGVEISPWEPVSRYLGKRKREIAPGT